MRKREGEKRTNWLLIKHRDKFSREGKKNRISDEDASVASSRSMEKIAAGKGRGPKPFVMAKRSRAPANAVESHRANPRIRGKKTVLSRNGANPGVDRARRLLELIAGRGGESVTMGCV